MPRRKYGTGDIFIIPMYDGRLAICQIIYALRGSLRKALPFGVLHIGSEEQLPDGHDGEFLTFQNHRGTFQIIFGAASNINKGSWRVTGHLPLTPEKEAMQTFQSSTHLYHGDEYLGVLPQEEWHKYPVLSVAGNERVQQYLAQYEQAASPVTNIDRKPI
ncbi:Imm26 family immunity protein [Paenibacillus bovis]|uniref:Uncharacterized protein n=1 Tax=Paenibacillus bovis TaxID=1616788 RepID=A0A172ZIN8_9BACL|nr:Imm26 family immunity protein [Paenibacillus bovis]ANF97504.1 hypothetical protein AR543_16810 [Paenibacillus bovis]